MWIASNDRSLGWTSIVQCMHIYTYTKNSCLKLYVHLSLHQYYGWPPNDPFLGFYTRALCIYQPYFDHPSHALECLPWFTRFPRRRYVGTSAYDHCHPTTQQHCISHVAFSHEQSPALCGFPFNLGSNLDSPRGLRRYNILHRVSKKSSIIQCTRGICTIVRRTQL